MSTSNRMGIIPGMAPPRILPYSRRLREGNDDGCWASSQLQGLNPTGSPAAADIPGLIPDEPIPSTTKRSLLNTGQAYNTAARRIGDRSMPAGRRLDPIGPAGQAAMEQEEDVDDEYTGMEAPVPLLLTGRKMQTERPGPDPEDRVQAAAPPSSRAGDNGDRQMDEAALPRHHSRVVSSVGREDTADEGTDDMLPAPSRTLRRVPNFRRRVEKDESRGGLPASSLAREGNQGEELEADRPAATGGRIQGHAATGCEITEAEEEAESDKHVMMYKSMTAHGSARVGGAGGEERTAMGCGTLTAFKAVCRALKAACSPRKHK
ncbi:hypothetical protein PLESTF_000785500 [Pleodorina starrii]|nr:hypothetical protein PLESTF_000785500 [Pleodorina starrii]